MEYNPRYPQPFTFSQALSLDPAVAWDEIARLKNSLLHLRRSQDEMREYLRGLASSDVDLEVNQAMKENEITIASQDERVLMLKLALTHHPVAPQQTSDPLTSFPSAPPGGTTERPQNTVRSSSNGLDDFPPGPISTMAPDAEQQENGVYL